MPDPMPDPTSDTVPEVAVCSDCSAPVAVDDGFCESCGAMLRHDAVSAAADVGADVGADASAAGTADVARPRPGAISQPCVLCAGEVLDDGFCGICGAKAATKRDHWTEQPSDDLAGVCDKGISHARNEDAMALAVGGSAAQFSDGRRIIVVCDGVTTAPESDQASLAASIAAANSLLVVPAPPAGVGGPAAAITYWTEQLRVACVAANAEAVAVARALGNPKEPPCCTFVAAVAIADPAPDPDSVDGPPSTLIAVAWCGDSRAYWFGDDGDARQLGLDHSLGTEMIQAGATVAQAEADPTSHTITRWLGADSFNPTPETLTLAPTSPGWLMVCSDGMWNYASKPEALGLVMLRAAADLGEAASPLSICEAMAGWANEQGGHDNITVALCRVNDSRVNDRTRAILTTDPTTNSTE